MKESETERKGREGGRKEEGMGGERKEGGDGGNHVSALTTQWSVRGLRRQRFKEIRRY